MDTAQGDRLRAIIKTQSEIASADLDSGAVMQLVAQRAQELTGARAGVIEVPDRSEMVYTVTTGDATPYLGIRLDHDGNLPGMADLDQVLTAVTRRWIPYRQDRLSRGQTRSMIAVPCGDNEAVRVLEIHSSARRLRPAQVETLRLLTESISIRWPVPPCSR
jgi:hypothetical protein